MKIDKEEFLLMCLSMNLSLASMACNSNHTTDELPAKVQTTPANPKSKQKAPSAEEAQNHEEKAEGFSAPPSKPSDKAEKPQITSLFSVIGAQGADDKSGGLNGLDELGKSISQDSYDPVIECMEWDVDAAQCRVWCEEYELKKKCTVRSVNLKFITEDQKKDCVEIIRFIEEDVTMERCVRP